MPSPVKHFKRLLIMKATKHYLTLRIIVHETIKYKNVAYVFYTFFLQNYDKHSHYKIAKNNNDGLRVFQECFLFF